MGRHQRPSQTEVQGQILTKPPGVLNEWPVQFPAAAGISAVKLLIVCRKTGQTQQKVRLRIAAQPPPKIQNPFGKPTATVFI